MKSKFSNFKIISLCKNIICIAAIFMICMELTLRITGYIALIPSNYRNRVDPEDKKKIRILVVGDSMSADFFSKKHGAAWPRQLEAMLLKTGVNARVYNEAIGGMTIPVILAKLNKYIEYYSPNIIITMAGINDSDDILYHQPNNFLDNTTLQNFHIVRLISLIVDAIKAKQKSCKFDYQTMDNLEFNELVEEGVKLAQQYHPTAVENALGDYVKTTKEMALLLTQISIRLRGDRNSKYNHKIVRPYIDRAFDLYPFHHDVAFWQLNDLDDSPKRCSDVSRKLLSCGSHLPDDLLSEILQFCVYADPTIIQHPQLQKNGFAFTNSINSAKLQNYIKLHEVIINAKAIHIAMQYPTLPINNLYVYLSGSKGIADDPNANIIFVSNQENFLSALKIHSYSELFIDRVHNNWGHCTEYGHKLIAIAVFNKLKNILLDKNKLKELN